MAASRAMQNQTIKDILDGLKAKWVADALALRIQTFETDVAVTPNSVLTDFTFATWAGGAAINWAAGDFGAAAVAANVATMTANVKTWVNTGGVNGLVWGYCVWENGNNTLLFAENFGAVTTVVPGGAFSVVPILKERSADF